MDVGRQAGDCAYLMFVDVYNVKARRTVLWPQLLISFSAGAPVVLDCIRDSGGGAFGIAAGAAESMTRPQKFGRP